MARSGRKLIEDGMRIADTQIYRQDKIWSRYSSDKVDIGETLARVIRTLSAHLPLERELTALSVGSSNEPQFRILQSAFAANLFLMDIEKDALEAVRERIKRQNTRNVLTIQGDFNKIFTSAKRIQDFRQKRLSGQRMDLVTFQHSLYYRPYSRWLDLIEKLYRHVLAPRGAIYMVLMSARSEDPRTTTWLYNHFAGRFANHQNDQCLKAFREQLEGSETLADARLLRKTSHVQFQTPDFKKLMAVVWMILLYPQVHLYTPAQREEITTHVYENFHRKRQPLVQSQDHLVIYRGFEGPLLI